MDNVAAFGRHAPTLELNRDILGEIFKQCDHLGDIRDLSQVCWRWREVLLKSPSVWAQAFDFDMLDQRSDFWRDLVLKRTGHELLSVKRRRPIHWNSFSLEFFVNLLDNHWARIRDVEIIISPEALDDPRIWTALSSPAPALQTFSCSLLGIAGYAHPEVLSHIQNLPRGNFLLFSNYAPSLTELSLLSHFPAISFNATSPTLWSSTSNLRQLILTWTSKLSDVDLLTACMQLPSIEKLSLSLPRFNRSPPSKTDALRPLVPRLKSIELTEVSPSIYSAFLDHIIPSADCALSIDHQLVAWSTRAVDDSSLEAQDIGHMGRVVGRYAYSYIEHEGATCDTIQLTISRQEFLFEIPGRRESQFQITTEHKRHERHNSRPDFLAPLVESLLASTLPQCITTLKMVFRDRNNFLCRAPPIQAFPFMSTITVLDTYSFYISHLHLGQLEQPALPFPYLDTIVLRDHFLDQNVNNLQEHIQPFLIHRYHTAPVKVLEFDGAFNKPSDLRFLDTLAGLKVVWKVDGKASPLEYMCGSGDASRLYFAGGPQL